MRRSAFERHASISPCCSSKSGAIPRARRRSSNPSLSEGPRLTYPRFARSEAVTPGVPRRGLRSRGCSADKQRHSATRSRGPARYGRSPPWKSGASPSRIRPRPISASSTSTPPTPARSRRLYVASFRTFAKEISTRAKRPSRRCEPCCAFAAGGLHANRDQLQLALVLEEVATDLLEPQRTPCPARSAGTVGIAMP